MRPVNTQLVDEPVNDVEHAGATTTNGDEVTTYPLTAAPLLLAGAVQVMVADALPLVAVTPVGAGGAAAGVADAEAVEDAPVPDALMAATVNV